jgi:alanine racemase
LFSTSKIELSQPALKNNVRFIKKLLGPAVRFSSVIKANAYGHGIAQFVPMAECCGLDHFSVFSAEEASCALEHRTKPDSEIVIMGAIDDEELGWAIENGIGFWVFEPERLEAAGRVAARIGRPAKIHLEAETGMHRTGLEPEELRKAVACIQAEPEHLRLDGLCTHFSGAESQANYLRIQNQMQAFYQATQILVENGVDLPTRHSACSAAAVAYPQSRMDLCRIGIMQFGLWPSTETRMNHQLGDGTSIPATRDPLRRVLRWTSRIMSLKDVPAGRNVGYGTSYLTTRSERLATIPVGYSHGFSRSLSNLGHVLVRGKWARVVGLVNMSMLTVDVTNIPGVQKGDEVVLIGKQGRSHITVGSFSDLSRALNYEVLVRLPSEIPRKIMD